MKISVKHMDYEKAMARPRPEHKNPKKCNLFWRSLIQGLTWVGMAGTKFEYETERMELLGKDEPCLILMNHSCFLDMQIAHRILYPRHFSIIATSDSFVGLGGLMNWVMRQIGCFPTQKFVTDLRLIGDMQYCFKELKTSVLMYPEASYSFDGTATTLPESLGYCLKKLGVPVAMIRTYGAFSRDPLYNGLQKRKVPVSADVIYLLSPAQIAAMRPAELNEKLKEAFSFDSFRWQQENGIKIDEPFRADYLNRVLYKCPHCLAEDGMIGRGTSLHCSVCGKSWTLTEDGFMKGEDGTTEFEHIPDWFAWERDCVREELQADTYSLDVPVDICILKGTKKLYRVGEGRLTHSREGFVLDGCEGKLHYTQKPLASYSLYADYYWYELGDVICIGDNDALYYCFPKTDATPVAKARLAAEELYKLVRPVRVRRSDASETAMEKNV